jgi:hypothetical protein
MSGHQCVLIHLTDPNEVYEPQESMRNVDIEEKPPCDTTQDFNLTIYNDSPIVVTIDVGTITFNVPDDWQITVVPSPTLEINPYSEGILTVYVTIPCPQTSLAASQWQSIHQIQSLAGSVPTIDVEGYNHGVLVGGIELQFPGALETLWRYIFLPSVSR